MSLKEPSSSTVDLLDLWNRSDAPKSMSTEHSVAISRSAIAERFSGERSVVWTSLSQMTPSNQALFMSKLASHWPYSNERRALTWPLHAGLLANCVTSALLATRVNADMILLDTRTSFLEAVRRCPKAPFVFGIYSSGLTYYVMQQMFISSTLYHETDPCAACLLTQSLAISAVTGLVLPMMSTPYLSYYVLLQRKNEKFPMVKNLLEFLMLSIEGSRAARPLLLYLAPFQFAVATLGAYTQLWGRNRVFSTLDADPEMAKQLLLEVQNKPSLKQKIQDFLRRIPFVSDIIGKEAPETEII